MHVEQVLGDVPRDKRCRCHEEAKKSEAKPAANDGGSWLRKIVGS